MEEKTNNEFTEEKLISELCKYSKEKLIEMFREFAEIEQDNATRALIEILTTLQRREVDNIQQEIEKDYKDWLRAQSFYEVACENKSLINNKSELAARKNYASGLYKKLISKQEEGLKRLKELCIFDTDEEHIKNLIKYKGE